MDLQPTPGNPPENAEIASFPAKPPKRLRVPRGFNQRLANPPKRVFRTLVPVTAAGAAAGSASPGFGWLPPSTSWDKRKSTPTFFRFQRKNSAVIHCTIRVQSKAESHILEGPALVVSCFTGYSQTFPQVCKTGNFSPNRAGFANWSSCRFGRFQAPCQGLTRPSYKQVSGLLSNLSR